MDYLQMLSERNIEKEALVSDGVRYTYGQLVNEARKLGESWKERNQLEERSVHVIKERGIAAQLISFLACHESGEIPLLVPFDCKNFANGQLLTDEDIPANACMAVATSGTTGAPKIYYRSYESWAGYFPIQNEIFGISGDSRLFAQGSLAFTGNLNLYMGVFYAGGTIVAETAFWPNQWEKRMQQERVNSIYLIPSKLMLLPKIFNGQNERIGKIITGSQGMGKKEALQLKEVFPNAGVLLYYGASELNYITYVPDEFMTDDRGLIGKPFPEVEVYIENGEIFVNTEYHVENIECPYSLSDKGYQDEKGNFYFQGRKDDIVNIRGRKVSLVRIENALESQQEIREAAVLVEKSESEEERIVAYVVLEQGDFEEGAIRDRLRKVLEHYEMPRRIYSLRELPKNESGKVDKKRLNVLQ